MALFWAGWFSVQDDLGANQCCHNCEGGIFPPKLSGWMIRLIVTMGGLVAELVGKLVAGRVF